MGLILILLPRAFYNVSVNANVNVSANVNAIVSVSANVNDYV